ncbi:unnamed protein product, partial [Ascophyllum nodosum]
MLVRELRKDRLPGRIIGDNASCRDRDTDTSEDTLTILPAFEPKNGGADDTITPTTATVATALGLSLSERLASDADKRPMFEHRLMEESGMLLSHQTIGPSESANSHSDAESIKTKG